MQTICKTYYLEYNSIIQELGSSRVGFSDIVAGQVIMSSVI